jgi:putative Mg2+ transporter-C (MgtC) family protein
MDILDVFTRLGLALLLGTAIGFERQWRQRMAGLRTNALVALGAASFTVFAALTPGEASPTRVAAQVVSGIGFLGAGVIMREGLNVRGLNSAATLWCAAAVGLLAGGGHHGVAALAAGLIVTANVALRPLVRLVHHGAPPAEEVEIRYRVRIVARHDEEAHVRALLLQGVVGSGLRLERLESRDQENGARVDVHAHLLGRDRSTQTLEALVGRLSLEPGVSGASWSVESAESLDD